MKGSGSIRRCALARQINGAATICSATRLYGRGQIVCKCHIKHDDDMRIEIKMLAIKSRCNRCLLIKINKCTEHTRGHSYRVLYSLERMKCTKRHQFQLNLCTRVQASGRMVWAACTAGCQFSFIRMTFGYRFYLFRFFSFCCLR